MKYGLSLPQFDAFGDIHRLVDLALPAPSLKRPDLCRPFVW